MLEYEDFAKLGTYLHELAMSVVFLFQTRYKTLLLHR